MFLFVFFPLMLAEREPLEPGVGALRLAASARRRALSGTCDPRFQADGLHAAEQTKASVSSPEGLPSRNGRETHKEAVGRGGGALEVRTSRLIIGPANVPFLLLVSRHQCFGPF